jgi:hypothetical protein
MRATELAMCPCFLRNGWFINLATLLPLPSFTIITPNHEIVNISGFPDLETRRQNLSSSKFGHLPVVVPLES